MENPLWASSSVQGRQALATYAPPEAVQCFREAGLLDGQDDEVVAWWDVLACRYRAAQDEVYLQIGRLGEKRTFDLESQRTGRRPKWVALEYSDAGYDVVSCVGEGDPTPFVIEVKTSTQSWKHASLYLSRAEWDVLIHERHAAVHLWSVHGELVQQICWSSVRPVHPLNMHASSTSAISTLRNLELLKDDSMSASDLGRRSRSSRSSTER